MKQLSGRMLRDLGLMVIAAAAGVYTVSLVTPNTRVEAMPQLDTRDPLQPVPPIAPVPPNPPQPPLPPHPAQGVHIYHSGADAYSVTIGNTSGVTEITHRDLGSEYEHGLEFMRLLKVRDPQLFEWASRELYQREAAKIADENEHGRQGGSPQKLAGQTETGMPVRQGETIVVPHGADRTDEEVERDYQLKYRILADAYGKQLLAQRKHAEFEAHMQQRFPEQHMTRVDRGF